MGNKVYGIVVLYKPKEEFFKNLDLMVKQVDKLICIDNTEDNSSENFVRKLDNKKITIIKNYNQGGIAGGLNRGIELAIKNTAEWIIFFDQDSSPQDEMISQMLSVYSNLNNKLIISIQPNYYDINSNYYYRQKQKTISYNYDCMTSGQLVKTSLFEDPYFYFDEKLFIYHVDSDFILKIKQRGLINISVNNAILNHAEGFRKIITIPVINRKITLYNHSSFALYYIFRNFITLIKRYLFLSPLYFILQLRYNLVILIKIILFETHKISKLKSIVKGIFDGLFVKSS
jgi:rhamnosyltransferase